MSRRLNHQKLYDKRAEINLKIKIADKNGQQWPPGVCEEDDSIYNIIILLVSQKLCQFIYESIYTNIK